MSARRGWSAAGSTTWVDPQSRQRTRRGRTVNRDGPARADGAFASVSPGDQSASATVWAAQCSGRQVLLGDLCGSSNDHGEDGSWRISLAYHTDPRQGPIGVGDNKSRHVASPTMTTTASPSPCTRRCPWLSSTIGEPSFVGTMTMPTTASHLRVVAISADGQPRGSRHWMCSSTLCADLTESQRLPEVLRMHDPAERAASLARHRCGPGSVGGRGHHRATIREHPATGDRSHG